MTTNKTNLRALYEDLRLLLKDTPESIIRLKNNCRNKKTHYVLINDHIGDVVVALGYLKAFRDRYSISSLTLVLHKKYASFAQRYAKYIDELVLLEQRDLYRLFLIGATRYGECVLKNSFPNLTIINPADSFLGGFGYAKRYPEITLTDMIKYGCLGLGQNAEFISLSYGSGSKNDKKRVLFTTSARTLDCDVIEICNKIAPILIDNGYSLYTNTSENSVIVCGSKKVFFDIDRISDFIADGIVIGPRSGIHDLTMYCSCITIAIYPQASTEKSLFALSALPDVNSKYYELDQSQDPQKDCEKILEYLRGEHKID